MDAAPSVTHPQGSGNGNKGHTRRHPVFAGQDVTGHCILLRKISPILESGKLKPALDVMAFGCLTRAVSCPTPTLPLRSVGLIVTLTLHV